MMARFSPTISIALALLITLIAAAVPASAWTSKSQESIAILGARLAPPDFYRQLERHRRSYLDGVLAPLRYGEPVYHEKNADGSGRLDEVIRVEVERAISHIWHHQPFSEIAYQAGVVSHYVADANNPLNTSASDALEGRYFADFAGYMESVEPRLQTIFYGLDARLHGPTELERFVAETLERGRALYPLVGQEYRRIGQLPGWRHFDDRSTAFGIAAVSYSRAVSDVALVLRYIWIEAGGADDRPAPREEERRYLLVPRPETR
jgi:hypothetical protein